MLGDYTCYYIHNSGEVCGRGCRRPEGCFDHWKSKKRFPCKVCGKPTSSEPGLCRAHVKGMQFKLDSRPRRDQDIH
ncbi:hypothetical protein Glove_329g8 [Diversispora epigaea]|uniref:Uncharacterized protein n=1 Tax=Diversispora epigaea TaxID=1348612 RepID=A0A397HKA3_9GLOM|nr:hypothetical protein Glove_329g8 [Diversispora epigaea]